MRSLILEVRGEDSDDFSVCVTVRRVSKRGCLDMGGRIVQREERGNVTPHAHTYIYIIHILYTYKCTI